MARRASGNDQIGNTVISMASIDAARRIMLSGRFVAAGRVVGSTSLSIWRFADDYVMGRGTTTPRTTSSRRDKALRARGRGAREGVER